MKGHFTPFTPEQEQKIKDEYLLKPLKTMAREYNCSDSRIHRFLKKNGLEIPRDIIEQRIKDSYLKKGHTPSNKGKKQVEYMSPEMIERTKATRFKKGNKSHNVKQDGYERIDTNGYLYVRINGTFKLKHRVIYESHFGEIPKGHIIIFKDENRLNFDIENLECISKIENMYRNSKHDFHKDLIPSLVLVSKIKNKIKNLENG